MVGARPERRRRRRRRTRGIAGVVSRRARCRAFAGTRESRVSPHRPRVASPFRVSVRVLRRATPSRRARRPGAARRTPDPRLGTPEPARPPRRSARARRSRGSAARAASCASRTSSAAPATRVTRDRCRLHDRPGRGNAGWSSQMSRCVVRNAMPPLYRSSGAATSPPRLTPNSASVFSRTRSSSSSGASTGRPLSVSATPSRSNMLAARRALLSRAWAPSLTTREPSGVPTIAVTNRLAKNVSRHKSMASRPAPPPRGARVACRC